MSVNDDSSNLPAKPTEIAALEAIAPYADHWLRNQEANNKARWEAEQATVAARRATEEQNLSTRRATEEQNLSTQRELELARMRDRRWYLLAAVGVLFAFMWFALKAGEPRLVLELMGGTAAFGAGWLGGKGAAKRDQS